MSDSGDAENPIAGKEEGKEPDRPMSLLEQKRSMRAIDHPPEIDRNPIKIPDLFFGIAWIIAVVGMTYVAIAYGSDAADHIDDYDDDEKEDAVKHLTAILIVVFIFALVCAQISMSIMMRFGGIMIHIGLFSINTFLIVMGVIAIDMLYWYLGVVLIVLGCLGYAFHYYIRLNIAFASACLHVGCEVVLDFPVLELTAFVVSFLGMAFFFVFMLATYGYYQYQEDSDDDDEDNNSAYLTIVMFIFLFIFFWTQQVFKYIITAMTADTAQIWWYGHEHEGHPSLDALARTTTYHLGSIAFGAFFVALIEIIVAVINYLRSQAEKCPGGCCVSCVLWFVTCCLKCCESILDYMNKYAFIYVGIHGYSYLYAGKQVCCLFATQGMTAINNDFFVEMIFFAFSIGIGLASAALGVIIVQYGPDEWSDGINQAEVVVGLLCGVGGYFVSHTVYALVEAANKAAFVLFIENPHVLEHTHEDDFNRLSRVWHLLGKEIKDEEKK